MIKQERADYIRKRLNKLYPNPPPPLNYKDPFTLLVAVVLSARCTDNKVNETTPHLFKLADNPYAFARQDIDKVRKIIQPCGLSLQKSKALVGLSKILIDEHNGEVPQIFEALEALPGVGHKTASVVMTQGFGIPAFPVDTHIHRLAQRWELTTGRNTTQTERDLKKVFPQDSWNDVHLQMIYYGRDYCSARSCHGVTCEICKACFPNRKKPKKVTKS